MNEVIERLEELWEQGEMVSRVLWPIPETAANYACLLGGPFGFEEQFGFQAESIEDAQRMCADASQWLYNRFLGPPLGDPCFVEPGESLVDAEEADSALRELVDTQDH